mmetsp:Transcript_96719/g.258579  ORF Transcript_96719/g.258579 Transcript_96719/m.258579 type:complete len:203 (-) Transcript_96719:1093-1701(-)
MATQLSVRAAYAEFRAVAVVKDCGLQHGAVHGRPRSLLEARQGLRAVHAAAVIECRPLQQLLKHLLHSLRVNLGFDPHLQNLLLELLPRVGCLGPRLLSRLPQVLPLMLDPVHLRILVFHSFLEHLTPVLLPSALSEHVELLIFGLQSVQLSLEFKVPFFLCFVLEELDLHLFLVLQDGVATLFHFAEPLLLDHFALHLSLE